MNKRKNTGETEIKIRNKTLYAKIEKFVISSISLLKEFSFKETVPRMQIGSFNEDTKIDSYKFVLNHSADLEKLPEFVDCAKYMLQNPFTLKALNHGWRDKDQNIIKEQDLKKRLPLQLFFFGDLQHLLARHIQENGGFVFVRDRFEAAYNEFERGTYSSHILHRLTAILEGFSGDIEELELRKNLRIRKMTAEEKSTFLNEIVVAPPFFVFDRIHDEYVLEAIYCQKKETPFTVVPAREDFNDIVTVLRLFKPGLVIARHIRSNPITWALKAGRLDDWIDSSLVRVPSSVYELNKSEKLLFLKLWRRFKIFKSSISSKDDNYLSIALKRFNFGIEENEAENKIVDFLIAFEALCLCDSEEIGYKLSNRVAVLLAKKSDEAEKIREFMKEAYRIRSKIVHGSKNKSVTINGKTMDLAVFTQKLEEYLRKILRSFLVLSEESKKHQEIISLIDQSFFDLKKRKLIQSEAK